MSAQSQLVSTHSRPKPEMSPVAEVLRLLVGNSHAVYSYRNQFAELWDENLEMLSPIVVVFDGVPQSTAEQQGLNLADRVTVFDWLVWTALRPHAGGFSVKLVDLASHHHSGSFGVQTMPMLLPDLPWVRLYRVFGKHNEPSLWKQLEGLTDDPAELAALLGRAGYGLDRLLSDLGLTDSDSVPLNGAETPKHVQDRISDLWAQALTRAQGRHEVANLIGPLILADELAFENDRGARELAERLQADGVVAAFRCLLSSLGLLRHPRDWKTRDVERPLVEDPEYFPPLEMSPFAHSQQVRFLLVDDQVHLGYGGLVSVLLTGKPQPPPNGRVSLASQHSPESLLLLLEQDAATDSRWSSIKVLGKDQFDVLLLDLRLFPEMDSGHPSAEERRFLDRLVRIGTKVSLKSEWSKRALKAAQDRLSPEECHSRSKPADPLQWVLLPLLLSEADPSLPIMIFSSTHQRDITEALHSVPNVVTTFAKPLLSGYRDAERDRLRTDLRLAVKQILELHEKRMVWIRLADMRVWSERPVYEVWDGRQRQVFNYQHPLLPPHRNHRPEAAKPNPKYLRLRSTDPWKPNLATVPLQQRLVAYFTHYLLREQYIDGLSAPFELFEECLAPADLLEKVDVEFVNVWFETDVNPLHNPIANALSLIRNKKAHGHARHGSMKIWNEWNDHTRFVAVILLFLCDFIEQADIRRTASKWGPRQVASEQLVNPDLPLSRWDACCMRVGWRLLRDPRAHEFLASDPAAAKKLKIEPRKLTTEHVLNWADVTAYTLALACREVEKVSPVTSASRLALERLILRRSTETLRLGKVVRLVPECIIRAMDGTNEEVRRPSSYVFPAPDSPGDLVIYARSADPRDHWVLGSRCLPDLPDL